jgi:hypothetical protein
LASLDTNEARNEIIKVNQNSVREWINGARYLCQLSTLILALQNNSTSTIAAAWVYASRKLTKITPIWSEELERLTWYKFGDIKECVNLLLINLDIVMISGEECEVWSLLGPSPFEVSKAAHQKSSQKEPNKLIILKPKTTSQLKRKLFSQSPNRDIAKIKLAPSKMIDEKEFNMPLKIEHR